MSSNQYADEGTIAHALAAMALTEGRPASAYVGRVIESEDYEHAGLSPSTAHRWMRCPGSHALETRIAFKPRKFSMTVTRDMANDVQVYLDNLAKYTTAREANFLVEQRLPVGHITGEEGATGSGDCVVFDDAGFELQVHDLKFGKGVEVLAEKNEQLALYLLGAMKEYEALEPAGGWQRFRGVIHQPRIKSEPDEYVWSRRELLEFADQCAGAAASARNTKAGIGAAPEEMLVAGEKQCRFCDTKATCPEVRNIVVREVLGDFQNLEDASPETQAMANSPATIADVAATVPVPQNADELARMLALVPMIDAWCTALTKHAEAELLAGRPVPGYKLVAGRRGNRSWRDKVEAENAFKSMRVKHDEMYDYEVISPTTAEERFKKAHPKQWARLQGLITQADGKPTVVPETDKRPALAITPVIDEFTALPTEEESLV